MRRSLHILARAVAITAIAVIVCSFGAAKQLSAAEAGLRSSPVSVDNLPYIFDIVADPSEPGSVLLATRAGLYRARQDGAAERISRNPNPLWSLSLDVEDAARLYARGISEDGQSVGVLVSKDRGRTWSRLASPRGVPKHLQIIEVSKAVPSTIYGIGNIGNEVWRSVDNGRRWASSGRPPSRIIDLAASAIDPRRMFAATMSDVWVSDDGGLSWKPARAARCRQPALAVDSGTDGTVYAFSLCEGLIRGDEITKSWTVVNGRFGGCIVQHLAVEPGNSNHVYAVLRCRKVLASTDSAVTWREFGSVEIWKPNCPADPVGAPAAEG